ncbi:MAG: hypothetical protein ACM3JJ_13325, partial [Hyphomicrobiales bacterium]
AALLLACGLPNLNASILDRDITNDRFALLIPDTGPTWNEERAVEFLRRTHPVDVRVVRV